jgi:hypothetical protein
VGYYDNILFACSNDFVRDGLVAALRVVCAEANAIFKGDIDISRGAVEMLGISFRTANNKVWWQHCEQNKAKWATFPAAVSL